MLTNYESLASVWGYVTLCEACAKDSRTTRHFKVTQA